MVIIFYFVFYGWNSILRYEEGGVTISRKLKNIENIYPPGILTQVHINPYTNRIHLRKIITHTLIIFIVNTDLVLMCPTWLNISIEIIIWPQNNDTTTKIYPFTNKKLRHVCQDEKDDNLKKCIENISYSFAEIVDYVLPENIQQRYFMWSYDLGLIPFLSPSKDSINFMPHTSLLLGLSHNLSYHIGFYDPKYRFHSFNPKTTPTSWQTILKDYGYLYMYIKVKFL